MAWYLHLTPLDQVIATMLDMLAVKDIETLCLKGGEVAFHQAKVVDLKLPKD
jgi:hypothetical protein